MPDTIASPNHNKARQIISFFLHNINNCRAHESKMNYYSNYNKTKLKKPYAYFMRCTASAEEDNLSPFDSNIVCLCQNIEINNNKYNKTKLNKTICIFYGMYCVCSNGSIRSQRSLLLTWCPFDASPITKPFMISVSRARRTATIPWTTILEPYHLFTSLQVVWNEDIRGWTAMFALGPLLLKEIGETIIEISTWISNHIA